MILAAHLVVPPLQGVMLSSRQAYLPCAVVFYLHIKYLHKVQIVTLQKVEYLYIYIYMYMHIYI